MSGPDDLRRSVPEGVAEAVSKRILNGTLRPGERLREVALAEEFDVSRNTIRASLLHLEHEGVVQRSAHRGCQVTLPAEEDVREIMTLRWVVEPGAVRLLARGRDRPSEEAGPLVRAGTAGDGSSELETLGVLARKMEEAADDGRWREYGRLDLRFHADLVAASGARRLADGFERWLRPLYLHFLSIDQARASEGHGAHVREHRRLVELVTAGEVEDAVRLMERHLSDAESALFLRGG